jgi:hypothetical protein
MDKDRAGRPCPACGAKVRMTAYLGWARYFCPRCQAWSPPPRRRGRRRERNLLARYDQFVVHEALPSQGPTGAATGFGKAE